MSNFNFRTIVTGIDNSGKSVIVKDEPTPVVTTPALGDTQFWLTWGTPDGALTTGKGSSDYTFSPVFPGPGGTRFMFCSWPPAPSAEAANAPEPTEEQQSAAYADAEGKLPGLLDVFAKDVDGFHTTDTVDYGILLEGELVLALDDGVELSLTPGASVIQRGTRHAWFNRTDKPALIMYVLLGADRVNA